MPKFKLKQWVIVANMLLVGLALPASHFSGWLNASLVSDLSFEPVNTAESQTALDFQLYDNFLPGNDSNLFQEKIIEAMDNAQEEILVAIYAFNIEDIKQAMLRAHDRGVKVTLLYAYNNSADFETFWSDAAEKIAPVLIGGNIPSTNYSMHHKFMLVDPGLPSAKLFTGSWNWSYLQEDLDPNMLMEISNPEIIASYREEFRRLTNGFNGFNKFQLLDFKPWMDLIKFPSGSEVEVWFSPGRERYSIQNRIVEMINGAESQIDIANTIVDSTEIGDALVKKAGDGVKVRMIFDHLNLAPDMSIYSYLNKRKSLHGLDNLELIIGGEDKANDGGQYSIFHHHNMIIDQKQVLAGTGNWTFGGFFLNDEDYLVIRDAQVAAQFQKSFDNYLTLLP